MKTLIDLENFALVGMGKREEIEEFMKLADIDERAFVHTHDLNDMTTYHDIFMRMGTGGSDFILEDEGEVDERGIPRPYDWAVVEEIYEDFKEHGFKTAMQRGDKKAADKGIKPNDILFGESGDTIAMSYAGMFGKKFATYDAGRFMPDL